MNYPLQFFEIQVEYARRVSEVLKIPFEQAMLKYTSLYRRIGARKIAHNNLHPLWSSFLAYIDEGMAPAKAAYDLYIQSENMDSFDTIERFGCMGYDKREERIIMHFRNDDSTLISPLSATLMPARMAELQQMFADIKKKHPTAQTVEGFCWLYNYDSYRRLFPPTYTARMEDVTAEALEYMSCWGQFITYKKEMNQKRTESFMQKVTRASTYNDLLNAFWFRVYKPSAKIELFYDFYKVV